MKAPKARATDGEKPGAAPHATRDETRGAAARDEGEGTNLHLARVTLEATPARAVQLMQAIGSSVEIRSVMARRGYTAAEQREGFELLRACIGFLDEGRTPRIAEEVEKAVAELDAWDETGFAIVQATLEHRYPDQARFVLEGIAPSTGDDAVESVRHLLDRLDALASSPARTATRREDHAALQVLARRGITEAERARLAELVEIADSAEELAPLSRSAHVDEHLGQLRALRAWYDEWASIARSATHRPEHLRKLGLAGRERERTE